MSTFFTPSKIQSGALRKGKRSGSKAHWPHREWWPEAGRTRHSRNTLAPGWETTWVTVGLVSRQHFVATGLKSYATYWFRVMAIGIDKEGLASDVVVGRAA